jgi:hypothetical protein
MLLKLAIICPLKIIIYSISFGIRAIG